MENVESLKKWLPLISQDNIDNIKYLMTAQETSFGKPLLRKYIDFIHPYMKILDIYNNPKEEDCLASGIVFFYGCMIYIMHFPNWSQYIEDVVLYNILYISVDHYIDNNRCEPDVKALAIAQMHILIVDPTSKLEFVDPILKLIADTYHKLITRRPNCKGSITKLFFAEIEGYNIQRDNNLDRYIYYDIALKKGGYTMQVMADIIGQTDESIHTASFHIGTIMQLVDDCLDIMSDVKNGINTIATHDKQVLGNLDNIFFEIVDRINNIDQRFVIYKILYAFFTVYIPTRSPNNYNEEIVKMAFALNLFDFDASVVLVAAVTDEAIKTPRQHIY